MTDKCTRLVTECEHGRCAALEVFHKLSQVQDRQTRATLLADAIGELIDVDLGWECMAPTLARLQGFAAGLTPMLESGLANFASPALEASASPCPPYMQAGKAQ